MDFTKEIRAINDLIMSAVFIQNIRKEVSSVMKDGFVVTDGPHHQQGEGYDVVVKCGNTDRPDVLRRIRGSMPDVDIEKIADGVLGIKQSRRMK